MVGARLLRRLPGFFRDPLTAAESLAIVRERLEQREATFISIARELIYGYPASPYRQLLALAGCEAGDLERLVQVEGVEGALCHLLRRGVYLTVEEFKGRRPVVRGSASFTIDPRRLHNPRSAYHVPTRTGGSRGGSTPLLIDLAFLRDRVANTCLGFAARGGNDWHKGVWNVPGAAIVVVLRSSAFGKPVARWFTLAASTAPLLDPRYGRAERLVHWGARLGGVVLPRLELVPVDDPLPIARWLVEVLGQGRTPHLRAFVSPMMRVCQAAADAGLDLTGAQLSLIGEPLTAARLATIQRSGAIAVPIYGSAESGEIAQGCLSPEEPDECHLNQDLAALIQVGSAPTAQRLPPAALLLTSLRPTMPIVMLNVSMGDQAVVTQRRCGCAFETIGWTQHLHSIRSFEKLTTDGMTFLDLDIIRALDETLPARFGGGPTQYQLVEAEEGDGQPYLRLLVDPGLGPLDAAAIVETFLSAIGGGTGAARIMGQVWRAAAVVRVERQAPIAVANGKIHHLHQLR